MKSAFIAYAKGRLTGRPDCHPKSSLSASDSNTSLHFARAISLARSHFLSWRTRCEGHIRTLPYKQHRRPFPPKNKKLKYILHQHSSRQLWPPFTSPHPLCFFVITVQQEKRFHTGFPFSSRLYISPAPSGMSFWRRFDFTYSYIYLS